MEKDDDVNVTPLVIGLTRPPMMWGIPFNAFIIILGVTLIAFLISDSFWAVLVAPVAYVALITVCSTDLRILDVIRVAASKTPKVPNKSFFGTNTYGP